jgi:hypothetical protein
MIERWDPALEDGSCDHEYVSEGGWPFCTHCETPAPEDYFDGDDENFYRAEAGQ